MANKHFQAHPQTRKPFIFEDQGNTATAAKNDPVEQQARAAEYSAMYLDRIETAIAACSTRESRLRDDGHILIRDVRRSS